MRIIRPSLQLCTAASSLLLPLSGLAPLLAQLLVALCLPADAEAPELRQLCVSTLVLLFRGTHPAFCSESKNFEEWKLISLAYRSVSVIFYKRFLILSLFVWMALQIGTCTFDALGTDTHP